MAYGDAVVQLLLAVAAVAVAVTAAVVVVAVAAVAAAVADVAAYAVPPRGNFVGQACRKSFLAVVWSSAEEILPWNHSPWRMRGEEGGQD